MAGPPSAGLLNPFLFFDTIVSFILAHYATRLGSIMFLFFIIFLA